MALEFAAKTPFTDPSHLLAIDSAKPYMFSRRITMVIPNSPFAGSSSGQIHWLFHAPRNPAWGPRQERRS